MNKNRRRFGSNTTKKRTPQATVTTKMAERYKQQVEAGNKKRIAFVGSILGNKPEGNYVMRVQHLCPHCTNGVTIFGDACGDCNGGTVESTFKESDFEEWLLRQSARVYESVIVIWEHVETVKMYNMLESLPAMFQGCLDIGEEMGHIMYEWEQQNKREGWSDFFNEPAHAGVIY